MVCLMKGDPCSFCGGPTVMLAVVKATIVDFAEVAKLGMGVSDEDDLTIDLCLCAECMQAAIGYGSAMEAECTTPPEVDPADVH